MTSVSVLVANSVPDVDDFHITPVASPASAEGWEEEEEGESGVDGDDDVVDNAEPGTDAQRFYMAHELLNFDNLDDDEEGDDIPDQDPLSFQEDEGHVGPHDGASDVNYKSKLMKGEDQLLLGNQHHLFLDSEEDSEDEDDVKIKILQPESNPLIGELKELDRGRSANTETENCAGNSVIIPPATSLQPSSSSKFGLIGQMKTVGVKKKIAVFSNLDVYRCFICRTDYSTPKSLMIGQQSDPELKHNVDIKKKAFSCGICGKPWDQPRKALACAVYGHDPSKLQIAMFCHACPMCPEDSFGFHSLLAVARHWALCHPEKKIPPFLLKLDTSNDFLPTVKVTTAERMKVTDVPLTEVPSGGFSTPLVLDNTDCSKVAGNKRKRKCCSLEEEPSADKFPVDNVVGHQSEQDAQNRRYVDSQLSQKFNEHKWRCCPYCNKNYRGPGNLKAHLMISNCNFGGLSLYKCVLCDLRMKSFEQLVKHRSTDHRNVPVKFNPKTESPFACGICGKPTINRKEAVICALYGHDPKNLRWTMFKHKCTQCPSLGFRFHSEFALKRHWEVEHMELKMPVTLEKVMSDKRLRKFQTSLQQLLHMKYDIEMLSLVKELDPPMELRYYAATKLPASFQGNGRDNHKGPGVSFNISTDGNLYVPKYDCHICGKTFKTIPYLRRHQLTHGDKRKRGLPKYKCMFCEKQYHLSCSLVHHRLKSVSCKRFYAKYQGMKGKFERWDTVFKTGGEANIMAIDKAKLELKPTALDCENESFVKEEMEIEIGEEAILIIKEELIEVPSKPDYWDEGCKEVFTGTSEEELIHVQMRSERHASLGHSNPSKSKHDKTYADRVKPETVLLNGLNKVQQSSPKIHPVPETEAVSMKYATLDKYHDSNEQSDLDQKEDFEKQPMRSLRSNANEKIDSKPTEIPNVNKSSHKCNICGKSFQNNHKLTRHTEVHEGQRVAHTCNVCQKSFNYIWNWKRHMKSHSKTCRASSSIVTSPKPSKKPAHIPRQGLRQSPRVFHSQPLASNAKGKAKLSTINIRDKSELKTLFGNKSLRILLAKVDDDGQSRTKERHRFNFRNIK